MPVSLLKSANLGFRARSLNTVGYTVYGSTGATVINRTTAGVHVLIVSGSNTGTYSAVVEFPDDFKGSIVWDTGAGLPRPRYAIEQYNELENNPDIEVIKQSVQLTERMTAGRWSIVDNQMIFYDDDNETEITRFSLLNRNLGPDVEEVFHRIRNDENISTAEIIQNYFSEDD